MVVSKFSEKEAEFRLLEEGEREVFKNSYPGIKLKDGFDESRVLFLLSGGKEIFVATMDQVLFSYIVFRISNENHNKSGHIISIYVKPNYREKGYAVKLLNYVEEILRSKGIDKLTLNVTEANIRALQAYKNYGFQTISRVMEIEFDTEQDWP